MEDGRTLRCCLTPSSPAQASIGGAHTQCAAEEGPPPPAPHHNHLNIMPGSHGVEQPGQQHPVRQGVVARRMRMNACKHTRPIAPLANPCPRFSQRCVSMPHLHLHGLLLCAGTPRSG